MRTAVVLAVLALALCSAPAALAFKRGGYTSPADFVVKKGHFQTLIVAANASGLLPTLSSPELVATAFLPADWAFNWFVRETGTNLTELVANTDALTNVLTYHIVGGTAYNKFKRGNYTLTTLNGQTLTIMKANAKMMIMDAMNRTIKVVDTDPWKAGNTSIFVLDNVLLPMM